MLKKLYLENLNNKKFKKKFQMQIKEPYLLKKREYLKKEKKKR